MQGYKVLFFLILVLFSNVFVIYADDFSENSPIDLSNASMDLNNGSPSYLSFILVLFVIIGFLILVFLYLRKSQLNQMTSFSSNIKVLEKKVVDSDTVIYVVKFRKKGYLLAKSSSSMVLMDEIHNEILLNELEVESDEYKPVPNFKNLISREAKRIGTLRKGDRL